MGFFRYRKVKAKTMPTPSKTAQRHNFIRVGVDTGGTFTDFVIVQAGAISTHKVLSTPNAPEAAILQGLRELDLIDKPLRLIHGSTVATNAVLEHKGVATGFVTNKGLKDVLLIGRQARDELYNLTPSPPQPLVNRDFCWELDTRLSAEGEELSTASESEIEALIELIRQSPVKAVAISFLFSFLDDSEEVRIAEKLEAALPDRFISRSSLILPEYKEYERGMATWLNAYVGPLVQGYLHRLEAALPRATVSIMQSNSLTCDAAQAGERAVNLLLSGPAGGLEGAKALAQASGIDRLMTLDMGGTSTDVALIDDEIQLTAEAKIGRYPVSVPMVDIHTIGAGGGSLAWIDSGGLLQVGPASAGANPGPVCYGQGGSQITVTDANLVLGRLPATTKLGGEMPLDKQAAKNAMQRLAEELGVDNAQVAAKGVIALANEHMAAALRVISVQRGYDPNEFVLVCFGGAGGMHICELAEALGMTRAMIPTHGGVLSALGMLAAKPGRQRSRTLAVLLDAINKKEIEKMIKKMAEEACRELIDAAYDPEKFRQEASLDLCYKGQSFTLNIPWQADLKLAAQAFHREHKKHYGHAHPFPIELVNLRVKISVEVETLQLTDVQKTKNSKEHAAVESVEVNGVAVAVPVYQRELLTQKEKISGPAILREKVATSYIPEGWIGVTDTIGNFHLIKSDSEHALNAVVEF